MLNNYIFDKGNRWIDIEYTLDNANYVIQLAKENGYHPTELIMTYDNYHYLHHFEK